jgi:hypothetical protein
MLKIDDQVLNLVQASKDRISELEINYILACQPVRKLSRKGQKGSRYLVLSEFNFYLYEAKPFSKTVKLTRNYSWQSLIFLSCQTDLTTAQFRFLEGGVTLLCPNGMDMVATVSQHLRTIFTGTEFPKEAIGVQEQYLEGYEAKKDAVIRRLRFKAFTAKRPLPPSLETELLESIKGHRAAQKDGVADTFDLTPFLGYYEHMDLILDAIMVMPEVHRLIVPASTPGKPLWPKLSQFFAANETVGLVETKEPPDKSFRDFVKYLSVKRASGIHELKFSDAEYDEEFMVQLAILFESREITVLSITNRATDGAAVTLAQLVPTCAGFQNLRELTLVGCPRVEANFFIAPLPKLRTFTAQDPKLDIGLFLSQFCGCTNSELESLTLISGHAISPIPLEGALPSRLTKLFLPYVQWDNDNLARLFGIIAHRSSDTLLTLDVGRAQLTGAQWDAFDVFLRDYKCKRLLGLVFDGNCIGSGFSGLLENSTSLQTLFINSCVFDGPEAHAHVAHWIGVTKSLHQLSLQGDEHQTYREVMDKYIEGVLENKSLRVLDITGNRIGNEVLGYLMSIWQNHRKMKEILFDRNDVTDLEKIIPLYEAAANCGRRICLRFPNDDFHKLTEAGVIGEMDVRKLKAQCAAVLRKKQRGRGQGSDDEGGEDGSKKAVALKPGEFLDLLVKVGGPAQPSEVTLGADLQDIIDKQNTEYIGDAQWIRATADAAGPPEETPELAVMTEMCSLEALLAQIV